jgi:dipeptidyl aminopeptidase/acylaminoacyl peptidase
MPAGGMIEFAGEDLDVGLSRIIRFQKTPTVSGYMNRLIIPFSGLVAGIFLCIETSLYAENGRLLSRTEINVPEEMLKNEPYLANMSNAVLRARFWKFSYESDGLKINGYMAGPKEKKTLPCLVIARGGNRNFGAVTDYAAFTTATYTEAGYFVIMTNYRGAGGSEGRDEFGGGDVNDILNLFPLIDSMKDEADPTRIGMYAGSRGGMMAYLTLARTKRIAAAVIVAGLADLAKNITDRPNMESNVVAELVPGYATNKLEALRARSAVDWPEKLAKETPILLLAGTGDWRVDPMDSLRMAEKLYRLKHPFRLVMFEGGDHGLTEFNQERRRLTLEWLDRYVRDRKPWPSLEPHGQ